ncbi:MAG TPA: hypothetical protein VMZ71_07430 [Gemmataceae bacterium]|nr:hypothetical protein [Gemmataceae bacterium]
MVSTSFTAAAFVVLSAGSIPAPNWQKDYATAMTAAVAQQKPMAVFIGQGEDGFKKLVAGGQFPAEAGQVLSSQYVSLYVNTDTAAGKALAGEFELSAGLVISTRGGAKQALRLQGTLNGTDLTGVLTTLGSTTTVTTGTVVPASYAVPSAPPLATYAAPASYASPAMTYPATNYAPQMYAPAYAPRTFSFGGGCANGRCGR